jgi:hypothetical protein
MLDAVNNVLATTPRPRKATLPARRDGQPCAAAAAGPIPGAACSIDAKSTRFPRELARNPDDAVQ